MDLNNALTAFAQLPAAVKQNNRRYIARRRCPTLQGQDDCTEQTVTGTKPQLGNSVSRSPIR